MATSGTYNFAPAIADLIVTAYGRCQIRRAALTTNHLHDAAMAANLLQVEWSNRQVNLFTVELATQVLTPEVASYAVDPTTIMIMAAYIETGINPPQDRIITSIGRDDYAAYPDKVTPGVPTVYWYDALAAPTITLWQPPDAAQVYTLRYYRARQLQDAGMAGGVQPEIPYRFLEAYTAALAVKVAEIWAPAELPRLVASADRSWAEASRRDVEDAPLMIAPSFGPYTRGLY